MKWELEMRFKYGITFSVIIFIGMLAGCSMVQPNKGAKSPNSQSSDSINAEKPPSSNSKTSILKIGSNSYEVSCLLGKERYFNALSTSIGIVWNPVPSMEGENLDLRPTSPYTLYLSPSTVSKLDTNHAQKILELPLQMDSPVGKMNVFLGSLFAIQDWVGYDISLASPGMNQAYLSKLYAVNLTNKKNVFITDFHVSGGYQFGVGSKDNILLYDQWVPNSQNDFTHIIHTFDLNTGTQSEVSANEVKMQNEDYIYKGDIFIMKFQ